MVSSYYASSGAQSWPSRCMIDARGFPMLPHTRRRFIPIALAGASTIPHRLRAADVEATPAGPPKTIISGRPEERGRAYGRQSADRIRAFLNREIYEVFTGRPASKQEMLRYAAACEPTLESVIKEVRRIPRAGWFSLILADDKAHLANIEVTPREVAVEVTQGRRARDNSYGTLQMNRKLPG